MSSVNFANTVEYVEQHSFRDMVYENPKNLVIEGRQFAIARLSNYAKCHSYDALVKFIEDNGGVVKPTAVKSADYLIITPFPISKSNFIYKNELEKYEKAISCHKTSTKPRIIRDIDFYIVNNMFSKLAIDDKRRMVMEYIGRNPNFNDKNTKQVIDFITVKARDDVYLGSKNIKVATTAMKPKGQECAKSIFPDEKGGTLQQWRKHFSLSEGLFHGKSGLILKKCKTLSASIRVPTEIEGKPIICVDRKAFSNLGDSVKEVILPSSVIGTENYSFYQCSSLQRIIIENPQCDISMYSFVECANLTEIIVNGINIAEGIEDNFGQNYLHINRR